MKEFKIQKGFLDSIRGKTPKTSPQLDVYEELVFLRFFDVINGCYPLFSQLIGEDSLRDLVKRFIQDRPSDPYVWNVPKEFFQFLHKKRLIKSVREFELLEFELSELKLYLSQHRVITKKFSWKRRVRLSKTAILKRFSSRAFQGDFFTKAKVYAVIYQNPLDLEIYHFEITPYMYTFLKLLRDNHPSKALKITNKRFAIKDSKSGKILEEGLQFLTQNGIIT